MTIPSSRLHRACKDFLVDTYEGVSPSKNHVICLVPNHIKACQSCHDHVDVRRVFAELDLVNKVVVASIRLSLANKFEEDVEVDINVAPLVGLPQAQSTRLQKIARHVIDGFVSSYQV